MKLKEIFLLILIIPFTSCDFFKPEYSNIDDIKCEIISVNTKKHSQKYISIDSLIDNDDIQFIRIKEFDKNPIAEVSRFYRIDTMNIIIDFRMGVVSFYDLHGNYLNKIDRSGRGPGEYLNIDDGRYNYYTKSVEILDKANIIRTYNLDGAFKNKILIEAGYYFHPVNDKRYMIFQGTTEVRNQVQKYYRLYEPDSLEDKNFLPFKSNAVSSYINNEYFYLFKDTVVFIDDLLPMIYSISDSGIIPRSCFNFNNELQKINLRIINRDHLEKIRKGEFTTIGSLIETGRYFLFNTSSENVAKFHIYDKKLKKAYISNLGYRIDKIKLDFLQPFFLTSENSIVFFIETPYLIEHQNNLKKDSTINRNDPVVAAFLDIPISESDCYLLIEIKLCN